MKQFISKVKNLSQKAVELKTAMQQLPPKVAEVREAVAATTGQLQQLKSEIQYSVADLKADDETRLTAALQEIDAAAEVFEKAGFILSGVDLEISPVQRMLVHLEKVEDVHTSILRSLQTANQHRKTTHAILSSLLQAKQMAETVTLTDLTYAEVAVGVGPVPSVRLCWRAEELHAAKVTHPPAIPVTSSASPSSTAPQSAFAQTSFFEKRTQPTPAAAPQLVAASVVQPITVHAPTAEAHKPEPTHEVTEARQDPLARFKKMPDLTKPRR
jgi:hypothetical protein